MRRRRRRAERAEPTETVEVEVVSAVMHEGSVLPAGSRKEVPRAIAENLVSRGLARRIQASHAPTKPEPKPEAQAVHDDEPAPEPKPDAHRESPRRRKGR